MHHSRGKSSISSISSEYTWDSQNRLPTPTLSDSSRNASPRSSHRRLRHVPSNLSSVHGYLPHNVPSSLAPDSLASTSSHEISLTAPSSDRTNAFFNTPSTIYKLPTPPHRSVTLPYRESDRIPTLSRSVSDPRSPPQSSARSDFFISRGTPSPSPTPALRTPSPPPKPKLPPLCRFFPSRYRRDSQEFLPDVQRIDIQSASTDEASDPVASESIDKNCLSCSPPSCNAIHDLQSVHSHPNESPSSNTPQHPSRLKPIPRETLPPDGKNDPSPGMTLDVDDLQITFIRLLGKGAFSSVWLARDEHRTLTQAIANLPHERRPSEIGAARRRRDRNVDGLRPTPTTELALPSSPILGQNSLGDLVNDEVDIERTRTHGMPTNGSSLFRGSAASSSSNEAQLVAVKMMDMTVCESNDRMRISFVREVEVLRHISHPNIVSYLHSFTTATHHCLVLESIQGGELFELLNVDDNHARMTEELLRRLWGELALAVGWMHEVALVHRDIKLENILLTTDPFTLDLGSPTILDTLPSPLLKISDFGLSRFIDPANPLLTTRCGSEYYAAPEIILGKPYDGRKTDAWAMGVVLYALATRFLPFDKNVPTVSSAHVSKADGVRYASSPTRSMRPSPLRETKRAYLSRIAKGEYHWPGLLPVSDPTLSPSGSVPGLQSSISSFTSSSEFGSYASSSSYHRSAVSWIDRSRPVSPSFPAIPDSRETYLSADAPTPVERPLIPSEARLATDGVRRVVGKLLVRDPTKRARIVDLWEDEWMAGLGAPFPPPEAPGAYRHRVMGTAGVMIAPTMEKYDGDGEEWMENRSLRSLGEVVSLCRNGSVSGRLVGGDTIPNVARQEAF